MRRARSMFAGAILILLCAALCAAVTRMPRFGETRGHYEQRRAEEAVRQRHVTNLDSFVNFDYRSMDTLGEEYILFATVSGLSLLLRDARGKHAAESMPPAMRRVLAPRSELVRWSAPLIAGVGVVVGCAIVMHGQLTPGGGFQGGVVVASMLSVIWFAYGYGVWNRFTHAEAVEPIESIGAGAYALTGLATIVLGGATFLENVVPLGHTGAVISGGTIWIVNAVVGVEVAAATLVIIVEFVHETRRRVPQ